MHLRAKYDLFKGKVQAKFKRTSSTGDVNSLAASDLLVPSASRLEDTHGTDHAIELGSTSLPKPIDNSACMSTESQTTSTPLLASNTPLNESILESLVISPTSLPHADHLAPTDKTNISDTASNSNWVNLRGFTRAIGHLASGFEPLKAVMGEVLRFVEIHEDVMTANDDYRQLKSQLEMTFKELQGYFSGDEPPAMTTSMHNLCRAIKNELEVTLGAQGNDTISRYLQAKHDQEEIVQCYCRIHGYFERFQLNASINIWKVAEKQAAMTMNIQNIVNKQTLEALLNRLTPSTPAYYNSAEATMLNRRACTPNTRAQVLHNLDDWIKSGDSKIFWLNGMAGTGKTTITNTLCAALDQSLSLAASFFCSRQLPECRNIKLIIPTLAHQLARYSSPFCALLIKALEIDPEVHTRALRIQFEHMLVGPLRGAAHAIPEFVAIVIDALDECEDKDGVGLLLELLIEYAPELPVKTFVSSRPEPQIRQRIGSIESRIILHELDRQVVQDDIKTYLEVELRPASPSDSDISSLVDRAGVLFIYAATVVRYVGAKNFSLNPRKRLAAVLDTSSPGTSNRTRDIDALYEMILASALDDPDLEVWDKELVKLVLDTIVCSQQPLTISGISGLLKLDDTMRVHEAIRSLWSVLHVSGDDVITTLHASFPDYMLDVSRSKAYGCHASLHHGFLAMRCFDRIKNNVPQFNICRLESSFIADEAVPNFEMKVMEAIPLDLWYACQYWIAHLILSKMSTEHTQELNAFLSERILLWMEVMNFKKQIGLGAELLERAGKLFLENQLPPSTRELARDAWRFVSTFAGNPVSISTPHIYVSMLASWPHQSPLASCYIPQTRGLIRVEGSRMLRRQPLLGVFSIPLGITCAALSPDSAYIVTGAWDNSLRIWDARTGHAIGKPFHGHANWINSVAFSPDGAYIASGSSDTTVRIWDVQTGKMISSPLRGHVDSVRSVAFSPNGTRVVSGSADAKIRIWDVKTKSLVGGPLTYHTSSINSVVFSLDGRRMASASDDKTIIIWDIETNRMIGSPLSGHTHQVTAISFSPKSKYMVSGSRDATLRIWDSVTGQANGGPLYGHTAPINSVTFSPDGTRVLSSSDDNTLRLWDPQTGQLVGNPLKCHSRRVYSGIFSADGSRIISISADKTIRTWDAQASQPPTSPLDGHEGFIQAVVFSPNGTRVVTGSRDKTIRIWDAITGNMVGSPLCGHTGSVNSVAFFPDGTRIVSSSEDHTIRIWDTRTGKMIGLPLEGHDASVNSVSVSLDGARIVSGSDDRTIRLWDGQTGQLVGSPFSGHSDYVRSVAFSPDRLLVVSGSWDKSIRLWDPETSLTLGTPLMGHSGAVNSVAFSPNGAYILSASSDRAIRMWDTHTKQMVFQSPKSLVYSTYPVTSIFFSPDGAQFISGSDDATIRIWDARTGEAIGDPLRGHTGSVTSVSLSPDGTKIASVSRDATLRIWDVPRCQTLASSSNDGATNVIEASGQLCPPDLALSSTADSSYTSSEGYSGLPWVLDNDQWVRDSQSHLLVWIPHDLRDTLMRPHNSLIISSEGFAELDFSHAKIGDAWTECYSPL